MRHRPDGGEEDVAASELRAHALTRVLGHLRPDHRRQPAPTRTQQPRIRSHIRISIRVLSSASNPHFAFTASCLACILCSPHRPRGRTPLRPHRPLIFRAQLCPCEPTCSRSSAALQRAHALDRLCSPPTHAQALDRRSVPPPPHVRAAAAVRAAVRAARESV